MVVSQLTQVLLHMCKALLFSAGSCQLGEGLRNTPFCQRKRCAALCRDALPWVMQLSMVSVFLPDGC